MFFLFMSRVVLKKPKKETLSKVKKDTWILFSKYIRLRDHFRYCPGETMFVETKNGSQEVKVGKCVTCGAKKPIAAQGGLQAGHFIPGRNNAVLFCTKGVNSQCLTSHSNLRMFNGGNKSIADIEIGDRIWGFDESTFERKAATVMGVEKFMPNELFEVEIENGERLYGTPDHKMVVNGKWMTIKEMLHNKQTYDIMEM